MTEYTEQAQAVDALRYCAHTNICDREQCPYIRSGNSYDSGGCFLNLMREAADMIEAQFRQVEELRQEIAEKDQTINELGEEIIMLQEEREAVG